MDLGSNGLCSDTFEHFLCQIVQRETKPHNREEIHRRNGGVVVGTESSGGPLLFEENVLRTEGCECDISW